MKNLLKLTGGIAVVACMFTATLSTATAQPTALDQVEINSTDDFDATLAALKSEWIVTRNYVIIGDPK